MYDPGKVKFNSAMVELSQIHPEVLWEEKMRIYEGIVWQVSLRMIVV